MAERRTAKQARAQDTVDVILTAAADVIGTEGYGRASTNRIATRAGVSVGSLYQYFANKDEIFHRLIERESTAMLRGLQSVRMGGAADGATLLQAYIDIGAGENNLLSRIFRPLEGEPQFADALGQIMQDTVAENATLILSFRPDLSAERAMQMATTIIACAEGIGREMRAEGAPALIEEFQTMVTRYVLGEP